MVKTKNVYIRKAKRKRRIKKFFILAIFFIVIGVLIVTKTNIFKVETIKCKGEILITESYINEKAQQFVGENIFTVTNKKVNELVKGNPYVKSISVEKRLPKTIVLNVKEKKGLYYIKNNGEYNVISNDLVLLERVNDISNENLIEIKGLNVDGSKLGDTLEGDERLKVVLGELYREQEVLKEQELGCLITLVDISDLSNIMVYLNDIQIKLGSDEDIREKMNKCLNIITQNPEKVMEYIDVSFNGTPDFKYKEE